MAAPFLYLGSHSESRLLTRAWDKWEKLNPGSGSGLGSALALCGHLSSSVSWATALVMQICKSVTKGGSVLLNTDLLCVSKRAGLPVAEGPHLGDPRVARIPPCQQSPWSLTPFLVRGVPSILPALFPDSVSIMHGSAGEATVCVILCLSLWVLPLEALGPHTLWHSSDSLSASVS